MATSKTSAKSAKATDAKTLSEELGLVVAPPKVDRKKDRRQPVLLSRSRRPKLGGVVTEVELCTDGTHIARCEHGNEAEPEKSFDKALAIARTGIPGCRSCSKAANAKTKQTAKPAA